MKTKSVTSIGALHPILFFAVMYVVVLFFSIFICSSLFYSCKSSPVRMAKKTTAPAPKQAMPVQVSTAAVLR
jgi:capsule polysaccharide export protein KpsE/RkpR